MKKVLKGIAIAVLTIASLAATAIKEIQDVEINQQIASSLLELFKP